MARSYPPGYLQARGAQGAESAEAEALIRTFRAADAELRAELERITAALLRNPESTLQYRGGQIRALLARIERMRRDLALESRRWVDPDGGPLSRIYASGQVRGSLLSAGAGQPSFAVIHREALEVLAQDTFSDLAAMTDHMAAAAKDTIRQATRARTLLSAASGTSVPADTAALVRTLESRGVEAFVDAAGRRWQLRSYGEMVVRTKSAQAFNTGTILQGEEDGTTVLQIQDGERSHHRECEQYSGRTCTAAWALAHPIEHPNCVRAFAPSPLHTGPVDFGNADRPSAMQMVRDAHALRRGDALNR